MVVVVTITGSDVTLLILCLRSLVCRLLILTNREAHVTAHVAKVETVTRVASSLHDHLDDVVNRHA